MNEDVSFELALSKVKKNSILIYSIVVLVDLRKKKKKLVLQCISDVLKSYQCTQSVFREFVFLNKASFETDDLKFGLMIILWAAGLA